MTKLAIASISQDPTVQIRRQTREEAIVRYMESWEFMPPVCVYKLADDTLLLSDGFNRIAAAQRLGLSEIPVDLREGTREEALEYAVIANTRSGEPLTPEERDSGIRRLHQLHPDYSQRKIASSMGVGLGTVQRVFAADEVRRAVLWRPVNRVADRVLAEVSAAPEHMWEPLLKAAAQRGWTRDQVELAVRNVKDDSVPEDHKRRLLAGETNPIAGSPGTLVQVDFTTPPDEETEPRESGERHEDPVGTDVAERLRPIDVEIRFSFELPGTNMRGRGLRQYAREPERVNRVYRLAVNRDGLEGLGDPRDPKNSKGFVMVLHQIQQHLWKRVSGEDWPRQTRFVDEAIP